MNDALSVRNEIGHTRDETLSRAAQVAGLPVCDKAGRQTRRNRERMIRRMIISLKGPLAHALRDLSSLVLFSLGLLALSAPILGAGRLHLTGLGGSLNDQVGYITTARKLAETGRLSSSCHYPSLLSQQTTKDYLYMPGFYCLLAGSYRLFGYGVLQSELPSLVCYAATNVLTYLVAARVYGRRVGLLASLLVAAYPPNLVFAFTAMMETAVVAAAMAALCAFVYLPRERRPYLTPLVLIIPFLFRETTAFLALPMALIISRDGPRPRPVRAMAFLLASVVVLTIVYRSDLSRGRGSFVYPLVSGIPEERIYTSITAGSAAAPTARVLIKALAANAWCNATFLRQGLSWFDSFELAGLSVLFLTDLLVLVGVLRRGAPPSGPTDEGRAFPIAALAFSGINIAAILILYKFVWVRGLRILMITAAPCLIAVAANAESPVRRILARMTPTARKWGVPALAVVLVAALMGYEYREIRPRIIENDPRDDANLVAALRRPPRSERRTERSFCSASRLVGDGDDPEMRRARVEPFADGVA